MIEGRSMTGLLAVPAFLLVLILVGMAVSTESRQDFEQRAQDQQQPEPSGQQGERPRPRPGDDTPGDPPEPGSLDDLRSGGPEGGQQPIVIRTEAGDIVVQVDEDGRPVRIVPSDWVVPTDPSRTLTPDPDGDLTGLRVTEDGLLEPVAVDDVQPGDFLTTPGPNGGVEILRPDGTIIQLDATEDGTLVGSRRSGAGDPQPLPTDGDDIVIQSAAGFGSDHRVDPATRPLVLDTDGGPIRIELEADGDLVANQPRPEDGILIDAEDLSAIRIDEDGRLEVVPVDEIGPDDTVLVPAGNGFDLVRPDGSRVEFRPDGENDGITATEITADGQEIELTPNPDGSVTLGDGTTVGPIDVAEDGGPLERLLDQTSDLPWPWVFGAIALLAALSVGTAFYLHRNRPDDPFDYSQFASKGVPENQLEQFLAILAADEDPRRAIRLAFYAAERGLAGLPVRRANETPFEWHSRVARMRPELAEPLGPICDMFASVRFSDEAPTTADRDLMIEHLWALNEAAAKAATARPMAGV